MIFELCSKASEGITKLMKNEETEVDLHFRLQVRASFFYMESRLGLCFFYMGSRVGLCFFYMGNRLGLCFSYIGSRLGLASFI